MGKITAVRRSGEPEFCVVGDHAYLALSGAELVQVVDALHSAGGLALEQRLRGILRVMPNARNSAGREAPDASTIRVLPRSRAQ
jgi:hypothetical protein